MTDAPEYADPERYADLAGFRTEWRDLMWNPDFLRLMARRWGLGGVREALDVGCGAGHWGRTVLRLLPAEATMIGVDREPGFFGLARDGNEAQGVGDRVSLQEGTAEALPFADDRFDLVTCQLVMIHVADVAAALREMIRVTRPGGLVVLAEPDNRAGTLALLGGRPGPSDDDVEAIVHLQLVYERGKRARGEGDHSVGGRLPGLLRDAGLGQVRAYTNDRCMELAPPYEEPAMKIALAQELAWAEQGVNILLGSRGDVRRLYLAGGGDEAGFERGWAAVCRWQQAMIDAVREGRYQAARGFV
ncbi:MAG: methyltransferase domain-containing protein, partial [Myxococcales bacterium]|nr:methyltransferase domain-containing protein [Myxococcales bacterium]